MKKVLSIICAVVLIVTAMCVVVGAKSFKPSGNSGCNIKFEVPKANPAAVVKDGIIGNGEYKKIEVNTNKDSTDLSLVYEDANAIDKAEKMAETMEFYFSWDDTHGFNFAVRYKPETQQQILNIDPGDFPKDDFLRNCGIGIDLFDRNRTTAEVPYIYYAIAKRTDNGEYLKGWWKDEERGISKAYDPIAGTDFIINYESSGYITYEWSIPFSEFVKGTPAAGTQIYLSLFAMAGTGDGSNEDETMKQSYGVSLGDRGYAVTQDNYSEYAIATLTDDEIPYDSQGGDTDGPDTDGPTPTPNPTPNPNPAPGTETVVKDNEGNTIKTVTNADGSKTVTTIKADGTTTTKTEKAPQTGDPMIIAAAVSAISACGIVIAKKRRG